VVSRPPIRDGSSLQSRNLTDTGTGTDNFVSPQMAQISQIGGEGILALAGLV
jgi:hypothetical protein